MRNSVLLAILVVITGCGLDFSKRFYQDVVETTPAMGEKLIYQPSNSPLVLEPFNTQECLSMLLDTIDVIRSKRKKNLFNRDTLYAALAHVILDDIENSRELFTKRFRKERHAIKYVLQRKRSPYKAHEIHVFYLDLLDLKLGDSYYVDYDVGTSPLHYYKGFKPEKSEKAEEDPEAIFPINEHQLLINFTAKILAGEIRNDMCSSSFEAIGLAVKLDPVTMKKNLRPRLIVVMILGAKRTQDIIVPKVVREGFYNHLN